VHQGWAVKTRGGAADREVPRPHCPVGPEGQVGCAFGPTAFPALGFLAVVELCHVAVGALDGPAVAIDGEDLGRGHLQVGGEEEV
jgi:hypothetical protein